MTLIALTMFAANPLAEPLPEIVLLDFTASYCPPCREMVPVIQRMQKDGFPIRKVDLSEHPDVSRRFQVEKIPTFILLVNGRETQRIVGKCSEGELRHLMNAEYDALQASRKSATEDAARTAPVAAAPRPSGLQTLFEKIRSGLGGRPGSAGVLHPTFRAQSPEPLPAEITDNSAMAATVRIRVRKQQNKEDVGTGSIVHSTPEKSTILTCAHLFRGLDDESTIHVDVFIDGRPYSYRAEFVAGEDDSDLAILQIQTNDVLPTVGLASTSVDLRSGDDVFSIGCNQGREPTHMPVRVVQVDRYLGPSNIVCTIDPAVGRSGGGLFNSNGRLVGVCSCADRDEHEGLYMGRQPIHQLFAKARLSHLLTPRRNIDESSEFAASPEFSDDELISALFDEDSTDVGRSAEDEFTESQSDSEIPVFEAAELPNDLGRLTTADNRLDTERRSPVEITVIVNSVDGTRPKEFVVIKRPSPWLLELLTGNAAAGPALATARRSGLSSTSTQPTSTQSAAPDQLIHHRGSRSEHRESGAGGSDRTEIMRTRIAGLR